MNYNMVDKYLETDRMSDLICDNYSLLQVMSRFGISLGFGDKSVKEVCLNSNVDCRTFLAVINFVVGGSSRFEYASDMISVASLMDYLKQSHIYFLEFNFPMIRRRLIEAIDCSANDVSYLILKFYDEYVSEVRKHMEFEERTVFKFVDSLLNGVVPENFEFTTFSKNHKPIDEKLNELKNIIIKYYPAEKNNNLLNNVLFDIFICEEGLNLHSNVEDYMFVPAVMNLERSLRNELE